MIQSNRAFAEQLYHFLKDNDESGHFTAVPVEQRIAELESYLSDLHMVRESIKDIEEISDTFYGHEYYVANIKPLLYCLREIEKDLESEQSRRMVGESAYEVKYAVPVGEQEIVFAEDKNAENGMCWLIGVYTQNAIMGQYANCIASDDYLEALADFTDRVSAQVETMRGEISQSKTPCELFTAEHCVPHNYSQSIDGKIVAIKAGVLRPEYRRGEVQIVLVNGGNGSRANPNGRAVYCYHLNNGQRTRFERHDVQGEIKPKFVPKWARDKVAEIQAERTNPPQKHSKNREDR